jgi:hypothetical protein
MISVATGGPLIDGVEDEYRARRSRIRDALAERGQEDPNPYTSLWTWHGKWSADLPRYAQRRQLITELYDPLVDKLQLEVRSRGVAREVEPTGWTKVDRQVGEAQRTLSYAKTEEQYQAIGLHCRESLISLAQTVYDAKLHETIDGVAPSEADAKRMLEAYLAHELSGSSNEKQRRHARAALDLAVELQHKRTANFRDAELHNKFLGYVRASSGA